MSGPEGLLRWRAVAKDGADLPSAQAIMKEARQSTLPGETYDFEFKPTMAGTFKLEAASPRIQMQLIENIEVE